MGALFQGEAASLTWRKSSTSGLTNCVEVAFAGDGVYVRDSERPEQGALFFPIAHWHSFVQGVKLGEFDGQ